MNTPIESHIQVAPGICGGRPHIAGHRIAVQSVVVWHERIGMAPDEIASHYGLTLGEVYAALAYYHDNQSEMDEAMRADETFIEELRRQTPSKLIEKLGGATH